MGKKFEGQIVLSVNGTVITQLKSFQPRDKKAAGVVQGQTPTGLPAGSHGGPKSYTLSCEVYIPKTGDIDWLAIEDAVIAFIPREGGAPRMYTGVQFTDASESFQEEGAATRRLEGFALRKVG